MRVVRALGAMGNALLALRRETGTPLLLWIALALLNLATQVAFRQNLGPGQFGVLNALFGILGLLIIPVFALQHALDHFHPREANPERIELFREAHYFLIQNFTVIWAALAALLLVPLFYLLSVPMFHLGFVIPSLWFILGAFISAGLSRQQNRLRRWSALLFIAALARWLFSMELTQAEPSAEAGLAVGWLAGLILLAPVFRKTDFSWGWKKAREASRDREFRFHFAATFSVLLAIFLFSSADRFVANRWLGQSENNNIGFVPWGQFDAYQTAGLLGRALIWGTQPLLMIFLVRRERLERTTPALRRLFWVYLGILVAGAALLYLNATSLAHFFGGSDADLAVDYIPTFAVTMVPIGMLQGIAIFCLASRRYPECFILGASSLAYTLLLYLVGHSQVMLSYMFGGSLVALTLVLFVGVVRWGRKQP